MILPLRPPAFGAALRRVFKLYRSTVGKKIVMAVTGFVLYGFVFVHMIGNLKIYQGPHKFNAYAEFLREVGSPALGHEQALWIFRVVLLVAVGLHIWSATALTLTSWQARGTAYKKKESLVFSYASRTMRWGGVIVAAFVIYHLLHLTVGSVHPEFEHGSAYDNVVLGFQVWPIAVLYMLCMLPLGLHMYHGLWSMTQTLGIENSWVKKWRRPVAAVIALLVVLGNLSIPLLVLTGIVRNSSGIG
jgi:succinate dehydrogenase / fumarate reductase cytochrome b subunit